jgi:monothiol glutaredoxin
MFNLTKYSFQALKQTRLSKQLNCINHLLLNKITYPQLIKINMKFFSEEETHTDFKPKIKKDITDENVMDQIDEWVKGNDCLLFMKGTREMPRCGFSNFLVQILNHYEIKNVKIVNILENAIVREAVKKYSNWPTYPQLYIKGNLVGK